MTHHPAFELKGSTLTLMFLHLLDTDLERVRAQLEDQIQRAPGLFADAPVAVDLTRVRHAELELDLAHLCALLRGFHMVPIGIRGTDAGLRKQALAAHLAFFSAAPATDDQAPHERTAEPVFRPSGAAAGPPECPGTAPVPARIVTGPIRSGQRLAAPDADLIVLGSVSPGAEVLAGRHIHVYGALRGRGLAGAQGDTQARIFCLQFDPDLIAIAGEYVVSEELDEAYRGQAVHVALEDDRLSIQLLGTFVAP